MHPLRDSTNYNLKRGGQPNTTQVPITVRPVLRVEGCGTQLTNPASFAWPRISTTRAGASLKVSLPKGIGRVEIWGAVGRDSSFFDVQIDPPAYGAHVVPASAFNLWTVHNICMYETVLDPLVNHSVNSPHGITQRWTFLSSSSTLAKER